MLPYQAQISPSASLLTQTLRHHYALFYYYYYYYYYIYIYIYICSFTEFVIISPPLSVALSNTILKQYCTQFVKK
jgi:hypothetical protein